MPSSSSTQRPQTFSNVQAQEASALLMLPQELRDKIVANILAYDPEKPRPPLAFLYSCKNLCNDGMNMISSTFHMVRVEIHHHQRVASVLQQKVKGLVPLRNRSHLLNKEHCVRFTINHSRTADEYPRCFLITDAHMLRAFVKAIALLSGVDLDGSTDPSVRDWNYYMAFLPNSYRTAKQQARVEATLCEPFLKYWWGGFRSMHFMMLGNQALEKKVKTSIKNVKWSNVNEYITTLDNARQAGKEAYNAGDIQTAYEIWKDGTELFSMQTHTEQGYNWNVNRRGSKYGTRMDEVLFHLHSNLAAACLKLANGIGSDPAKQHKKLDLARELVQEAVHANDWGQMQNFKPSNVQMSKAHYRRAQGLVMLGKLEGATKAMQKASDLKPNDKDLKKKAADMHKQYIKGIADGTVVPGHRPAGCRPDCETCC